ncbi:MAG TPA: glycosyltransferase family 4 protein [Syntrophales bacterium]|nr:glycosyltransferase family 4 protein [Syntrophales bacterium]
MKKHILFIVENQPLPSDVRVWSEIQAVKELGYDVTAISPVNERAKKKYEIIDGVEIFRHPMPVEAKTKAGFLFEYVNALFWELFLSVRIFLKKRFHIIHGANPPDHIFIVALFFKLFGTQYIFDHHDITPENYLAKFGKNTFVYKILLIMEMLTFKTADIVISTNESYKKIAINRGKKNRNKVFVVRNGPDMSKVIFMSPNERLKKGFDYLVAYLGVIGNQEGIDILLKTIHHIVYDKDIKNIGFMIIGTGPDWNNMVRLSKEMKIDKYVTFTGFIPYKNLYEILATADVCVNPEFRNEFTDKSTMIKIMDYMVFGKPIIQFETTEGKVTAGNAALYLDKNDEVEFAEAIINLLNDPEKRKEMGKIATKRIKEKLNWDIQKVNLKKAYTYLEQLND